MTWIYLPDNSESFPCSQAMGDTPLDCDLQALTLEQSAMSSMTSTPSRSYSSDSETASIPLPYGMTSTPSTPNPGEDTLISSQPVSPANHIPKPEPVGSPKDLTMIETFGPRHESAFGWYDQNTQSLRTFQASFSLETEDASLTASKFWGTFPHWGLMQDGEFIAQPTPALRTSENGGGSWHIPTPTPADVYTGNMKSSQQSDGLMPSVSLPDYVEMFPTPSTMDYIERKGMRPSRAATNRTTGYLSEEVVRWATPTGEDANNVTRASGNFQSLSREVEGSLNPDWVEQHLMSLPEGWTRLEPVPDGAYDEWFDAMRDGTWWDTERGLPRVTTGAENRVNRLKMLGNGIVPGSARIAIEDMSTW